MRSKIHSTMKIARPGLAPLLTGTLALTVVIAACVYMVLDARAQVELRATETAQSLVRLLERDIERNIEVLDLSLQAVTEGVARPDIMAVDPALRRKILFDRSASATGLGALIVFDKDGRNIVDSLHDQPLQIKPVIDRDYFQAQVAADRGLFISRVYQSRLINKPVIGLSRRINSADGGFLGVALATIEVDYLSELISRIQIGTGTVVTLLRTDGTALLRQSPGSVKTNLEMSKLAIFQRMQTEEAGVFVGTSQADQIERLYGFHRVGNYPLILSVGMATGAIYADWWQKTILLILLLVLMTAVVLALLARLLGELKLKAETEQRLCTLNRELETLSLTDSLTGLGNRRYFDEMFGHESRRSKRTGGPVSLALIDIDHFKLFNDHYGHAEGDRALKLVADAMKNCLNKPGDMIFRVGGEEFAVVLPETDEVGVSVVGQALCRAVRNIHHEHVGSEVGYITISIGLNTGRGLDPAAAYDSADMALYAAKRAGRNRVTPILRSLAG